MVRNATRWLVLFLTIAMLASLAVGCGSGTPAASSAASTSQAPAASAAASATSPASSQAPAGSAGGGLITDTPVTLTYYTELGAQYAAVINSFNEAPLQAELERITGVHIEYEHPPVGQESEKFNLLIASGKYPDIIDSNWTTYPGGPEKAIQDGVILKLNDLAEQHAPNLLAMLERRGLTKIAKTDDGTLYNAPYIVVDPVWFGPQMRQDWLDALGITELPETVDEYETVLRAMRDAYDTAPFTFLLSEIRSYDAMINAWKIPLYFYNDKGQIKYGAVQPEYKDFLTRMNQWYQEGIIDADFALMDAKTKDTKITEGKVGAYFGSQGGGMSRYLDLMKDVNPDFKLVGLMYPVLNKGETPVLGEYEYPVTAIAAISTSCKTPDIAMKWLDFGYTDEGHLLYNFGIEGESYNMIDGKPIYSDFIKKNPDGLPMAQAMSFFIRGHVNGPFEGAPGYIEQYRQYPCQNEAVTRWEMNDFSMKLPPVTPTVEESGQLSNIRNQIDTYVDEMLVKFIMGTESLDKFDEYIKNVENLQISEAIAILQGSLERFNNR